MFIMQSCSSGKTPIVKSDKFSKGNPLFFSCGQPDVCTRPNIASVVGVLGRYLSDPGQSH